MYNNDESYSLNKIGNRTVLEISKPLFRRMIWVYVRSRIVGLLVLGFGIGCGTAWMSFNLALSETVTAHAAMYQAEEKCMRAGLEVGKLEQIIKENAIAWEKKLGVKFVSGAKPLPGAQPNIGGP
jgi:hypothetical protein